MKGMLSGIKKRLAKPEKDLPGANIGSGVKSDVGLPKARERRRSSSTNNRINCTVFHELPNLKDQPAQDRAALFIRKLQACCIVFDFNDPTSYLREKELKRQNLLELVNYINDTKGVFNDSTMPYIMEMLCANLYRVLPPSADRAEDDEEDPILEPAWPHLQIIYEFVLRLVVSSEVDAKVAKKFIDNQFVSTVIDLFESEDPRERDYLKTILHRMYGKFMVMRSFIRKSITNTFYRFVYETEQHNGIAELLEILGSIINGFALPLKDEHKMFLQKSLIPLHKHKGIAIYHQQLSYCITQFVEKDPNLLDVIVKGLLAFWPICNSPKEVLFLNEVEEMLELVQPANFVKVQEPLCKQISRSLGSPHFQVAERALLLWNNEYIVSLFAQNRAVVLPTIFGALYINSMEHWNSTVQQLTVNVLKMFMDMDSALFDQCSAEYEVNEKRNQVDFDQRALHWKELESSVRNGEIRA